MSFSFLGIRWVPVRDPYWYLLGFVSKMPGYYGSRNRRRYGGRGAYTVYDGPWANRGEIVGRTIGGGFGGLGSDIGGWLGRRLFHYPAKWMGSGAYRKKPARAPAKKKSLKPKRGKYGGGGAYQITGGDGLRPMPPSFQNDTKDDSVVITHREYLGDIVSSSSANTFKVEKYPINPCAIQTFPVLLSQVAPAYQQYKFEGCIFEFQSFSADALNSTNTSLGAVFACINYDSLDSTPASRAEVENTDWAMAAKPSEDFCVPVECARRQTVMGGMLYNLQTPTVPSGADAKTYFLGNLFIGTTGCQGTSVNLGSLYVTYKVRLYKVAPMKPLPNANRVLLVRTGCTSAAPYGTATDATSGSSGARCDTLGITFTSGTVVTIDNSRLQVGARYLVMLWWYHDSGATTTPSRTWSAGLTNNLGVFPSGNSAANSSNSGQVFVPNPVATTVVESGTVDIIEVVNDNVPQTITLSGSTLPANAILNFSMWQVSGVQSSTLGIYTP